MGAGERLPRVRPALHSTIALQSVVSLYHHQSWRYFVLIVQVSNPDTYHTSSFIDVTNHPGRSTMPKKAY